MGLMDRRRMMESAKGETPTPTPTIGGLIVYADNCLYASGNGRIDSVTQNDDFFQTGIFDTGTPYVKDYEITRFRTDTPALIRFYDDLSANSVDYWTIMRTDIEPGVANIYTFNSAGRYVVISVAKYCAADFYFKYRNGDYICKGNNVT